MEELGQFASSSPLGHSKRSSQTVAHLSGLLGHRNWLVSLQNAGGVGVTVVEEQAAVSLGLQSNTPDMHEHNSQVLLTVELGGIRDLVSGSVQLHSSLATHESLFQT